MGIEGEKELMERVVASAIVSVGTKYIVDVERQLLMLRLELIEKGNSLGDLQVLSQVEERLRSVHDRMDGLSGDIYRLMLEVKREFAKLTTHSNLGSTEKTGKKRGRPPKTDPTTNH